MPIIKFPTHVVYRVSEKPWCISRGEKVVQNVECNDSALAGELIMKTQTPPDVNINTIDKTISHLA